MNKKRVAIFVSGSGTNMENIAVCTKSGKLSCDIVLVLCDNPNALALSRAQKLGLDTYVVERKNFGSKTEFDSHIHQKLMGKKVEAIFLAGYMRILTGDFVKRWQWRIINIHPSLLPKYPGPHSIQDAFEAKEKETGVTIHFVDEGVDSGPVIAQEKVPIMPNDSLDSLTQRVHETEYKLYPEALQLWLEGKATGKNNKVIIENNPSLRAKRSND